MNGQADGAAASLEALGFTPLEARIYLDLLRNGPQTGYRLAQHVGKAAANTYKALETLANRGVVACEDGEARLYRATPYAEVAAAIANDFAARARAADEAVRSLEGERTDDRVYRLSGSGPMYARARALLAAARHTAVVDAFPEPLARLAGDVRTAAARGVKVWVHAYAPATIDGAHVVVAPQGAAVRARWGNDWLNVSVDGERALIAQFFDGDRAVGVWTENPHVAWTLYCGLASETALVALGELAARHPAMALGDAIHAIEPMIRSDLPGRDALAKRTSPKKGSSR